MDNITIRKTTKKDLQKILDVQLAAFNGSKKVKNLITDLLDDQTAKPCVSLLALDGDKAVGHILFSRVKVRPHAGFCSLKSNAYIMGPIAVLPDYRQKGISKELIRKGLQELKDMGISLCFTLGHSNFKPGFGFQSDAAAAGWPPPFPISDEHKDAWMWLRLTNDVDELKGKIICANAIMRTIYWKIRKREQ